MEGLNLLNCIFISAVRIKTGSFYAVLIPKYGSFVFYGFIFFLNFVAVICLNFLDEV